MRASAAIRLAALALTGAALAASAGCGTRALTANTSGGGGTGVISIDAGPGPDGAFQPTRDVDILFMIDNTSGTSLLQDNLMRNFPTFITILRNLPGGLPNLHIAVDHVRHGRGRRIDRGLRRRRRRRRHIPVHRARDVHLHDSGSWRHVHLRRRRREELHRQPRRCVHLHRDRGQQWLRLRAAARVGGPRARRGRPARAGREPGLPAPGRPAVHRAAHERGRLLGAAGERAVRHDQQPEPRLAARPAGPLPLQRVRASVQRRQAAPPRADRERERRRDARRLRVGRKRGHADATRDAARADPIAETVPERTDPGRGHRRAERAVHH